MQVKQRSIYFHPIVFFPNRDQFRLVLLFSSKAFLVASQWRNNNFHFSRIEEMRPQAMMELYLYLKNKERHILEGNPLRGSLRPDSDAELFMSRT